MDVDGEPEDQEPSQSLTVTTQLTTPASTLSTASTSSMSAAATSFAIYPNDATDTVTNNAFQNSLYALVSSSDVYASTEEGVGVLFWLANLTNVQQQDLSNYGVSLNILRP